MSAPMLINFTTTPQKLNSLPLGALFKSLAILGLVLFLFYISLQETYSYQSSDILASFKQKWPASSPLSYPPTTNISHIVFGIIGSMNTWNHKRSYVKSWWRSNVTRGYLFLDRYPTMEFLPWPNSSYPPFRVNEDITKQKLYPEVKRPDQIRIVRTILETFREGDKDVRWFVMADDDTILFVDNLVEVLAKYDHTKYLYIGANSECVKSNFDFSFNMAFGGAGYALSYPLAAALATKMDKCIQRYIHLWVSDFMLYSCLTDLGVPLTYQKGLHQIDLVGDISGLLSAHPQTPLLSLHHIDTINPIFPSMNRSESINHLMKAAKVDHSRILQQTICYHRLSSWSVSITWGYSVHVYENIFPASFLKKPLETFGPWNNRERPPLYMFNTRPWPFNNPCETPHVFYFDSITETSNTSIEGNNYQQILTTYARASPRGLPACSSNGNLSADSVTKIHVFSSPTKRLESGERDCCNVVHEAGMDSAEVIYRACTKDETIS
ncbi:hypothetical protein FNV43_RR02946 [Rhamnella rubrinervis]|uniref:Uncharacterized protein n=1 Tax=Rhamnella rubrinervis TaxID=2594499 RepID=A0A8K0MNU0_9ROSA|nr:hypothetical protein FNV43_RR02946 [Rhamnella rubrinervis]